MTVRKKDFAPDFAPLFGSTSWTNDTEEQHVTVSQGTVLLAGFEDISFDGAAGGGSADERSEALLEEYLEEGDSGGGTGTSTSLVAGGVTFCLTFSGIEGEVDLPFLPDGPGTPFGQPLPGTRGLSAVFTKTRSVRVLSRKLGRAFLGLASALEEREALNRDGNLVSGLETGINIAYGECTCIYDGRHKEGFELPSVNEGDN